MKYFKTTALLAFALCIFTACSNYDDPILPSNDSEEKDDASLTAEEIAEMTFDEIISYVCATERDPKTFELKSWQVNYGKALYPATPTVRYAKAASQDEARNIFMTMLTSGTPIDSSSVVGILTADVGKHGTITYTPQSTGGELARITVNLKDLPELTQIVLLKPSVWPENSDPYLGIYNGDVFKRNGVYFVCIKDCANGDGYLVGFNMSYYQQYLEHSDCGDNCYDPFWWGQVNASGTDIIRALHQFLYRGSSRDTTAAKTFKQIGDSVSGQGDELVKALYNEKVFFKIGDDHMYIKGDKGHHNTFLPYTMMQSNGTVESRKVRFYCDKIDTKTCDRFNNTTDETGWGDSLVRNFGKWWKDATVKWNQFMEPYVIVYHNYDADSYNDFLTKQNLSVPNF